MNNAINASLKLRTNQKPIQKLMQKQSVQKQLPKSVQQPRQPHTMKCQQLRKEQWLQQEQEHHSGGDSQQVNSFRTCDELMQCLPQVLQLRDIFERFIQPPVDCSAIDVMRVPECLRAMGLRFDGATLKSCLTERLLQFPKAKPPNRVSFELLLMLYSELAEEVSTSSMLLNGLRSCDGQRSGLMPLDKLRRMLTTVGRRLNEIEICAALDTLQDDKGNVNYVMLLETMFAADLQAVDMLKEVRLYLDAVGKNASHMDMHKRDEFIVTLRNLDVNCSGYIDAERLLNLLNANGDRFTVAELATLTRGMTNCRKQIDYRLFLRLIMND